MTQPTPARMVHVTAVNGECLPAVVIKQQGEALALGVFSQVGYNPLVLPEGPAGEPNTWHWPERA